MSNPLHAAYYADRARQYEVEVELRRELAHETYLVRFRCPEIAATIYPGQFLMVRPALGADPLLGRAFAIYDVIRDSDGNPTSLDVVFHVVGKTTGLLATASAGDRWAMWGPLGNGFTLPDTDHLIMVAGGIGQTPFLALAKECLGQQRYGRDATNVNRISLLYGARSENLLAGLDDFEATGMELQIATDDGSAGHHGFVTDLLKESLDPNVRQQVVCCGPEPMMEAVAKLCLDRSVPCQVSLETPMACGLGICFSCVTKVHQADGSWDYKRTCVDGPVFDAADLAW